ncbi:MAG: hypothetical protein WBA57_19525 [Elainellaceae cyanobacterium]
MKSVKSVVTLSALALFGTLALPSLMGTKTSAQAQVSSRTVEELSQLCESFTDSNEAFQCLLNQSGRLNRAKNLARQRGEQANGGVTTVETEPSMHGSSSESPYEIEVVDDGVRYIYTYRLRPRATANYTIETQVVVNYHSEFDQWDIDTVYNRDITPTTCSYSSELAGTCL